ncbi:MAG: hypothetical protein KDJ86_04535 [Bauldia sp.]|uniref:hypothetical protein n=1 Tax=Bauldia sp. TaxID=2575872 RepID=UPI001DFDBD88|nr:hypothetical protein [Bauldia sp.]MCB1495031.1 hypothetical protein [Bauldia sp.]
MADPHAHILTRDDGTLGVISPFYFCLEGKNYGPGMKPGRTWRLTDQANTSVTAVCKSSIPIENEIQVHIEATGEEPLEHTLSREYDADGLTLKFKKSLIQGATMTWGSGLVIPTAWFLKEKIESTSLEIEPISGGPLKFSAMFRRFRGGQIPIPGVSDPDEASVIQIDQKITAVKTGIEIVDISMFFGLGVGIIGADGRIISRTVKYRLDDFSDN